MPNVTALIAAAGQGTRMAAAVNKQLLLLGGHPLLAETLRVFQQSPAIEDIILVASAEEMAEFQELVDRYRFTKVRKIVTGGRQRQDSVACGLENLLPTCQLVAVHDGARPLLTAAHLAAVIGMAAETGAALLAVPVKDTLKIVGPDGLVVATPDRASLWAVQTPQVFRKEILRQAYARAAQDGFSGTDDASLVEHSGCPVHVVMGSYENIKVTTPDDLALAELLMRRRGE